mmetsp:Transcript_34841/g.96148  ORF Transcript_34841/g.96148 Transcript_34841/m.96148 type:complete len:679 (-) Transcript_34841:38-2074(-)
MPFWRLIPCLPCGSSAAQAGSGHDAVVATKSEATLLWHHAWSPQLWASVFAAAIHAHTIDTEEVAASAINVSRLIDENDGDRIARLPEGEELGRVFAEALEAYRIVHHRIPSDARPHLRAYFKQATVGQNVGVRPNVLLQSACANFDAWASLGQMARDDAKREYCKILDRYAPGWRPLPLHGDSAAVGNAGLVSQRMAGSVRRKKMLACDLCVGSPAASSAVPVSPLQKPAQLSTGVSMELDSRAGVNRVDHANAEVKRSFVESPAHPKLARRRKHRCIGSPAHGSPQVAPVQATEARAEVRLPIAESSAGTRVVRRKKHCCGGSPGHETPKPAQPAATEAWQDESSKHDVTSFAQGPDRQKSAHGQNLTVEVCTQGRHADVATAGVSQDDSARNVATNRRRPHRRRQLGSAEVPGELRSQRELKAERHGGTLVADASALGPTARRKKTGCGFLSTGSARRQVLDAARIVARCLDDMVEVTSTATARASSSLWQLGTRFRRSEAVESEFDDDASPEGTSGASTSATRFSRDPDGGSSAGTRASMPQRSTEGGPNANGIASVASRNAGSGGMVGAITNSSRGSDGAIWGATCDRPWPPRTPQAVPPMGWQRQALASQPQWMLAQPSWSTPSLIAWPPEAPQVAPHSGHSVQMAYACTPPQQLPQWAAAPVTHTAVVQQA